MVDSRTETGVLLVLISKVGELTFCYDDRIKYH